VTEGLPLIMSSLPYVQYMLLQCSHKKSCPCYTAVISPKNFPADYRGSITTAALYSIHCTDIQTKKPEAQLF